MQIIVDVHIVCKPHGGKESHFASVGKVFETDLVPMVGMEFSDPVWTDAQTRPITNVTIDPTGGYYYIYLGEDTRPDESQCQQLKEIYHSHGWTRMVPRNR